MKERPILMSAPMVRAILDGRKTQTRRVCALAYDRGIPADAVHPARDGMPIFWWHIVGGAVTGQAEFTQQVYETGARCPWGMPGDRLWVRETWAVDAPLDQVRREHEDMLSGIGHGPYYRADTVHENTGLTWRPSIHMPRWASRLTLKLTAVRVERLHRIGEASAEAEGVYPEWAVSVDRGESYLSYCASFARTWDELYGKTYPWEANPWVWVLTFAPMVVL